MTETEVVALLAVVSQISPAQKIDEFTADSWYELLDDLSFADARVALTRVAKRQPFIAPADIRAEVRVIRKERVDKADASFVPSALPQSFEEYQRDLLAHRRAVGDGGPVPEAPALTHAVDRRELASTFRRPPRAIEAAKPELELPPKPPVSAEARREAERLLAEARVEAARSGELVGAVEPPERSR